MISHIHIFLFCSLIYVFTFFMYFIFIFIFHICILCAAGDEEQHDQPERLLQEGHVLSDGGN